MSKIVGDDGLDFQIWCKTWNHIDEKEKLLAPKLDTLQKHKWHNWLLLLKRQLESMFTTIFSISFIDLNIGAI
jgi:hypothetical protein